MIQFVVFVCLCFFQVGYGILLYINIRTVGDGIVAGKTRVVGNWIETTS